MVVSRRARRVRVWGVGCRRLGSRDGVRSREATRLPRRRDRGNATVRVPVYSESSSSSRSEIVFFVLGVIPVVQRILIRLPVVLGVIPVVQRILDDVHVLVPLVVRAHRPIFVPVPVPVPVLVPAPPAVQEEIQPPEQRRERPLHGDVRLHRPLQLHELRLRLGRRRDVPGVVQHHRAHPPRELFPARGFGSHAIQRRAQQPRRRVRRGRDVVLSTTVGSDTERHRSMSARSSATSA